MTASDDRNRLPAALAAEMAHIRTFVGTFWLRRKSG
jgi:hypothetical protein